jgi:cephalosporin hydroxylase
VSEDFARERRGSIQRLAARPELRATSVQWLTDVSRYNYSYHFTWMGRPIIQLPQDILAVQEIIWNVKPDLIVETGVAHGGSLIFCASMLALINGGGRVVGVDIDIRPHNRTAIESHPMSRYITLLQGSSTDDAVVDAVGAIARGRRTLVLLDSSHTHAHVREELRRYSPLVTRGSYLVVFDTIIEDMPEGFFPNRPWGKGNNPKTAVREFLRDNDRFEIDREMEAKLLITVAPEGYLRCIKD